MKIIDLFEGRDAPLYHATSIEKAEKILKYNEILAITLQKKYLLHTHLLKNYVKHGDRISGVSLTRDIKFAKNWGCVIFVLDQRLLSQHHTIYPINFWTFYYGAELKEPECEEFVIGPILNVKKYIKFILIEKNTYLASNLLNEPMENLKNFPLLIEY